MHSLLVTYFLLHVCMVSCSTGIEDLINFLFQYSLWDRCAWQHHQDTGKASHTNTAVRTQLVHVVQLMELDPTWPSSSAIDSTSLPKYDVAKHGMP